MMSSCVNCSKTVMLPVSACTSLCIEEKRNTLRSSPWTPHQVLPGQEGALNSSSEGKTGFSSPLCGMSCTPLSCLWRPECRQLSTWRTAFPVWRRNVKKIETPRNAWCLHLELKQHNTVSLPEEYLFRMCTLNIALATQEKVEINELTFSQRI